MIGSVVQMIRSVIFGTQFTMEVRLKGIILSGVTVVVKSLIIYVTTPVITYLSLEVYRKVNRRTDLNGC